MNRRVTECRQSVTRWLQENFATAGLTLAGPTCVPQTSAEHLVALHLLDLVTETAGGVSDGLSEMRLAYAGRSHVQLAAGFSAALDALGLVVPSAGGGDAGGGAWADMSSQSHGEWAASMVQGLAGSSYKSSW